MIFIVDELDRCRPDYAVEVLEKIKHFFSVKGVVFVLSIDKEQLGNSIRGYYGSEKIEADEYLRRFIDIEYALPEPDIADFCKYLYTYFGFSDFYKSSERSQHPVFENEEEMFLKLSIRLCSENRLSLRQIEKIFAYTRLVLRSFNSNMYVYPDMLFLMIYIKYYKNKLYTIIKSQNLSIQEFVNNIGEIFTDNFRKDKEDEYTTTFTSAITKLIHFYNNRHRRTISGQNLIEVGTNGEKYKLTFSLPEDIDKERVCQLLCYFNRTFHGYDMKLKFFVDKIDLLEPLQ